MECEVQCAGHEGGWKESVVWETGFPVSTSLGNGEYSIFLVSLKKKKGSALSEVKSHTQ